MARLSMLEIGRLAYDAGVRSQSGLQAAIAIAMAESGGDPGAVGDVGLQNATWGPSLGLWQVRSLKAETGKGTVRDANRLTDPAFNARAMYSISKGGKDWGPWSTWPLRAAVHMPAAAVVARGIQDGSTAVEVGVDAGKAVGEATGLADVGTGVRATYNWVSNRNNWMRVAKVGIGSILVVAAVYAVANPGGRLLGSGAAQSIIRSAPTGKVGRVLANGRK